MLAAQECFVKLCENKWFMTDNFEDRAFVKNHNTDIGLSYLALFQNGNSTMTFSFVEPKTQKIIYGLIEEKDRKAFHIQCIRSLKAFFEDDLQSIFPVLALHAFKGGALEDEIFLLHKASQDSVRLGLLEDAESKFTRILILSEIVKFKRFDQVASNFTIPSQKAQWNLALGECQYILGKIEATKSSLQAAADLLDINTNLFKDANDAVSSVQKSIKSLGYSLSSLGDHSKHKIDLRADTMGEVKFRVIGRMFVMAAMDLDEKKYLEVSERSERAFLKTRIRDTTKPTHSNRFRTFFAPSSLGAARCDLAQDAARVQQSPGQHPRLLRVSSAANPRQGRDAGVQGSVADRNEGNGVLRRN